MNYIRSLRAARDAAQAELRAKDNALQRFRAHLASEKFQGFEADGSRKDWIAVVDVFAGLTVITDAGASQEASPAGLES